MAIEIQKEVHTMNERAGHIIEALDQENLEWKGRFVANMAVGRRDYQLIITENEESIEMVAWLPVTVDEFRMARARSGVSEANDKLRCAEFHLDEEKGRISFRLYDLNTGMAFTAERMTGLLDYCRKALETYAEPLCDELSKTILDRFRSMLGVEARGA